jgi:F-type H+-transporting ATPase subunit epsilon
MAIPPLPTKLTLEIVTPDRSLVTQEVDEVEVPGTEGYLGILPGHTQLLATLGVGDMWYRIGAEKIYMVVAGGFLEVLPDRVTILAQVAERAEDIDVARAEQARARAEERLTRPSPEMNFDFEQTALRKAQVRLNVAQHARARV